jgi:small subunit ribosomal protein S17
MGKVVSDKMDKTAVVTVTNLVQHPRYKKTVKRVSKFKAHDPENSARVGDTVKIVESRPFSKDKRWAIVEVMEKA